MGLCSCSGTWGRLTQGIAIGDWDWRSAELGAYDWYFVFCRCHLKGSAHHCSKCSPFSCGIAPVQAEIPRPFALRPRAVAKWLGSLRATRACSAKRWQATHDGTIIHHACKE